MGAFISVVKAEAAKQNLELEKQATDSLTALQDLAKLQIQIFRQDVRNDKDVLKIRIKKMISDETSIQCGVATDAASLAKSVTSTYKAFASGDIANGIGSVLSAGLTALFGNAAASSNQTTKYFITLGELGYPLRIDLMLYTYSFTSEALTKVTKNVVATSIAVSSVDLADLDEATIGATVSFCYGDAPLETQKSILKTLIAISEKFRNAPHEVLGDEEQEKEVQNALDEIRRGGGFEQRKTVGN